MRKLEYEEELFKTTTYLYDDLIVIHRVFRPLSKTIGVEHYDIDGRVDIKKILSRYYPDYYLKAI